MKAGKEAFKNFLGKKRESKEEEKEEKSEKSMTCPKCGAKMKM